MRRLRSPVFFVLTALVAVTACRSDDRPRPEPAGAEGPVFENVADGVAYVGDETCATCHEEEYRGYQSHGMAQSFYRLTPDRAVEDFSGVTVEHPASGFTYTVYREGDRFVQEEYRTGAGGVKTHRLVRTMDYVVGSGSAARTYLTEIGGRLYELPLTWYTQANEGRGRWDLSPGYAEGNGRFDRTIPPRCMACHNGTSEPVAFLEGAYSRLEDGIGCEQCHGPGALHVEARLADPEPAGAVDLTIVNPAHLPLALRLDVCQQCHTNGTVSVLREGEEAFGFRPSRPLAQHVALYALGEDADGRLGVISHADRMQRSPCFIESGAMDCVTCHNPHEGFRDAGPSYFNTTCIGCHPTAPLQAAMPTPDLRAEHSADANCFSCHMPKVEADDAPHSSFTDHYIRVVRAGERIEGVVTAESGELEPYFERDEAGADAALYRGMANVIYGRQSGNAERLRRGVRQLGEALAATPDRGEAQFLLGFARLQLGEAGAAIPALEAALAIGPESPERLNALAQALERTGGDGARIEASYRRALALQPRAAAIRVNLGRFLEAQGRLAEATTEYRQAAHDEPVLAVAHYNLGTALLRQNQINAGAAALREALRLQPDHADALANLGAVVASQGRIEEARGLFERAVRVQSQNANALANLALAYAQLGDAGQARAYAQRALAIDPAQQTARQVLAAL